MHMLDSQRQCCLSSSISCLTNCNIFCRGGQKKYQRNLFTTLHPYRQKGMYLRGKMLLLNAIFWGQNWHASASFCFQNTWRKNFLTIGKGRKHSTIIRLGSMHVECRLHCRMKATLSNAGYIVQCKPHI